MTIINPNSISGISSITALNSTAAINLFKADGTSANIIAGVTTGSNFITGTSNVHSTGYECTNINASGIVTAASLDISGDIDFDGHTELDNVNVSGIITSAAATVNGETILNGNVSFYGANYGAIWRKNNSRFQLNDNAELTFGTSNDTTIKHNNSNLLITNTTGNIDVTGNVLLNNDLDVDGHTNLDNVSVSGTSTFINGDMSLGTTSPNTYTNQRVFTINGTTHGRLDLEVAGTLRGSVWGDSGGLGLDAGGNSIEMYTGSHQRVFINTSGQMGIGQNFTPSRQLDVKDATGANRIMNIRGTGTSGAFLAFLDANTTDDSKCRIGSIGGNNIGIRGDSHSFQDGAGNDKMVITTGGDMGLGTNSPASSHDRVLTIAGTNSAELKLTGSNYGVTDTDGADVLFSYGGLYLINNESTGNIHFHTGSGVPERLRITSAGLVGIGTQTPESLPLTVAASTAAIALVDTDRTNSNYYSAVWGDQVGNLHLVADYEGAAGSQFISARVGGTSSSNEKLRITSDGKVGINETNPDRDLHISNASTGGIIRLTNTDTTISNGTICGMLEFEQRDSNTPGVSATIRAEMQDTTNGNCAIHFQTGTPSTIGTRMTMHGAGIITTPIGPLNYNSATAAAIVNTSGRQLSSGNDFSTNYKQNLSVGWYTIATNTGGRAWGKIGIRETYSSRHQAVTIFAGHHYGGGSDQNSLHTISSGRHSGNPLGAVRIKAYGTYDGAMLQVYLRDGNNGVQAYLLGDNIQTHGWKMKDWIADGTDPGDLGNWTAINNNGGSSAYADLNNTQAGGTTTDGHIIPGRDNATDLGTPSYRFDDVFATNTTIQGSSDERLKQDIAALTTAEMNAAKRMSALFKTYRWKDRVLEKGDKARTHTGVIAQQVKAALEAEGLDPTKYGFYGFDEWYEDSEGTKLPIDAPTRQGDPVGINTNTSLGGSIVVPDGFEKKSLYSIRIGELLAFIAAYNEQRFTSIESRLTALEST